MKKQNDHQVKSIITRKQGFWISVGIIIGLLIITGNMQKIAESVIQIFNNITISITLPSFDMTDPITILMILVMMFIVFFMVKLFGIPRDEY